MAAEHASAYEASRLRISTLVTSAPEAAVGATVPACPDWSVKDVVSHLAGLAGDWISGNIAAYGSEEWTAAQVESRRDRTAKEVVDEWADYASRLTGFLTSPEQSGAPAFMPAVVLVDLATHEHDIRGGLGAPGARDSDAVVLSLGSLVGGMRQHMAAASLAPLEIEATGHRSWMVGRGEAAAKVRGNAFELFRATGGRRTEAQVRRLDWEGDPEPYLESWLQYPFAWPDPPLDE